METNTHVSGVPSQETLQPICVDGWDGDPRRRQFHLGPSEAVASEMPQLHPGQCTSVRTDAQLETFFAMIRNEDRTPQIQSLMVIQTGTHHRRVSTRRPSPFQWSNERKAAFIFKNQHGFQLTPLFLSMAKCISSNAEWPPHLVAVLGVADADCSSQSVS